MATKIDDATLDILNQVQKVVRERDYFLKMLQECANIVDAALGNTDGTTPRGNADTPMRWLQSRMATICKRTEAMNGVGQMYYYNTALACAMAVGSILNRSRKDMEIALGSPDEPSLGVEEAIAEIGKRLKAAENRPRLLRSGRENAASYLVWRNETHVMVALDPEGSPGVVLVLTPAQAVEFCQHVEGNRRRVEMFQTDASPATAADATPSASIPEWHASQAHRWDADMCGVCGDCGFHRSNSSVSG